MGHARIIADKHTSKTLYMSFPLVGNPSSKLQKDSGQAGMT